MACIAAIATCSIDWCVRAEALGLRSVLVTFDPHPLEVVNPAAAPLLLTVGEEKLEVLAESGIDYLAVVPFTPALARLSAEEFVSQVLRERFRMKHLLMGYDHGFGRNREGDVEVLQTLGERDGFRRGGRGSGWQTAKVDRFPRRRFGRRVAGGDLEHATNALGRPYSVGGRVVPGAARGEAWAFRR